MYAEKFELLEAKIRETVMLVSRLREEKRHLEQENAQLRECLEALEDELQDMREAPGSRPRDFETLLQRLENLQEDDTSISRSLRTGRVMRELEAKDTKSVDEYFQLGTLYERKGRFGGHAASGVPARKAQPGYRSVAVVGEGMGHARDTARSYTAPLITSPPCPVTPAGCGVSTRSSTWMPSGS
jgi:hypothetical protein